MLFRSSEVLNIKIKLEKITKIKKLRKIISKYKLLSVGKKAIKTNVTTPIANTLTVLNVNGCILNFLNM